MSSHITGYDNRITGFCFKTGGFHSFLDPSDSGCGDKYSVYLPFTGHLCITGHDFYTGFIRCFFHGSCNLLQLFHGKSFFYYKCTGKIQGFCTHAGQVIDCTADTELSDVASRKFSRRNDKTIGCKSQLTSFHRKYGSIVRCQIRICKMRLEYLID